MVVNACNLSLQKAETVQGHPQMNIEFEVNLGYRRHREEKIRNKKNITQKQVLERSRSS